MFNSGLVKLIEYLDMLYQRTGIHTTLSSLLTSFHDAMEQVNSTFSYFISGIYFIFGKPLVIWFIGVVAVIITIRIALAIINLIYP